MPKGKGFSEEERSQLREIVLKYKDVVENKQSDAVSLKKKKSAWEQIAQDYNGNDMNNPRDASQLKKLWENIKFRRKAELAAERRSLMKTGGGSTPNFAITKDPELDSCGVDIEIPDAIDSDTISMLDSYSKSDIVIDEVLVPVPGCPEKEPSAPSTSSCKTSTNGNLSSLKQRGNREINKSACLPEAELRKEKALYLLNLEKELGEMRKEEQRLRIELLKQQLETAKNDEECKIIKRKLEIDLLKKQLQ